MKLACNYTSRPLDRPMKRSNRCFWDNMDKMTTWEQQSPICSASRAWQHPATTNCHLPHWLDVSMATHGVRDAASGWAETSQMHSPQLEWVMTRRMLIPPKNQDGGEKEEEKGRRKRGSTETTRGPVWQELAVGGKPSIAILHAITF